MAKRSLSYPTGEHTPKRLEQQGVVPVVHTVQQLRTLLERSMRERHVPSGGILELFAPGETGDQYLSLGGVVTIRVERKPHELVLYSGSRERRFPLRSGTSGRIPLRRLDASRPMEPGAVYIDDEALAMSRDHGMLLIEGGGSIRIADGDGKGAGSANGTSILLPVPLSEVSYQQLKGSSVERSWQQGTLRVLLGRPGETDSQDVLITLGRKPLPPAGGTLPDAFCYVHTGLEAHRLPIPATGVDIYLLGRNPTPHLGPLMKPLLVPSAKTGVSAAHALLLVSHRGIEIADQYSTNGTYVGQW